MSWAKSDGAKIKVSFDQPITTGAADEQSHFTVTVPEYNFVPGGTIGNVTKAVLSTYAFGAAGTVDLSGGALTNLAVSNSALSLGVA